MNKLTPQERELLQVIRDSSPCPADCRCRSLKRGLADRLRAEHPDVDDVTIARILLTAVGCITAASVLHRLDGPRTAAIASGAAVELAALELDHPT
jgi:hypothetical protein